MRPGGHGPGLAQEPLGGVGGLLALHQEHGLVRGLQELRELVQRSRRRHAFPGPALAGLVDLGADLLALGAVEAADRSDELAVSVVVVPGRGRDAELRVLALGRGFRVLGLLGLDGTLRDGP